MIDSTQISDYFEIGWYPIYWEFSDIYGNTAFDTNYVWVIDEGSPVFTDCVDTIETYFNENCQIIVPDFTGYFNVLDESGDDVLVEQFPLPSTILSGNDTIFMTANDEYGNSGTCSFLLLGIDTIGPEVFCEDTMYLCSDLSAFEFPNAVDACGTSNSGSIWINELFADNWNSLLDYSLSDTTDVIFESVDENDNSGYCESVLIPLVDEFIWDEIPNEICEGDTLPIVANSDEYTWSTSLPSTIVLGTYYSPQVDGANMTDSISLFICGNTYSQTVLISDQPEPELIIESEICSDETLVTSVMLNDYDEISWTTEDEIVNIIDNDGINAIFEFESPNENPSEVTIGVIVNNGSCSVESSQTLNIYSALNTHDLDAGEDMFLFDCTEVELDGSFLGSGTIQWTLSNNSISSVEIIDEQDLNTQVANMDFGIHEFVLMASNGICGSISDTVIVEVSNFIPNAFSPDNNGIDDYFVIQGINSHEKRELEVFNTWGALVYQNSTYNNEWDGRNMKGENLTEGTYYYVFRIADHEFTGFVIIKRQ